MTTPNKRLKTLSCLQIIETTRLILLQIIVIHFGAAETWFNCPANPSGSQPLSLFGCEDIAFNSNAHLCLLTDSCCQVFLFFCFQQQYCIENIQSGIHESKSSGSQLFECLRRRYYNVHKTFILKTPNIDLVPYRPERTYWLLPGDNSSCPRSLPEPYPWLLYSTKDSPRQGAIFSKNGVERIRECLPDRNGVFAGTPNADIPG